jgi:Protein of unknown function (DUF3383)
MVAPLPISNLIQIGLNLAAQPVPGQSFQTMLLLGPSPVIDTLTRFRSYTTFTQVSADFASTMPEYVAAELWFEQNPAPAQLYIGRWVQTAAPGQLICGTVSAANQAASVWTAITTGSFTVSINGAAKNITGLNFSAITNMNGVASVIQTALNSAVAGTTCVWNAVYSNFIITSPTTGASSTISLLTPQGAGVDISTLMGGTVAGGAYAAPGLAAESALSCVTYFDTNYPTMWFGLFVTSAGELVGGPVTAGNQVIGVWTAITTGSFTISINGAVKNITGLNFSAATKMSDVASVIQTALNSAVAGTTCVWNSATSNFIITAPTTSTGSSISVASTYGTGVDISTIMAGTAAAGAQVVSVAAADYLAIAGYVEATAGRHFQGINTQDPNCLNGNDTTNIGYQLQQLKYNWSAIQYSSTSPYAVISMLGRILTTDWSASGSAISLMYKSEPGVTPEALTATQAAALKNFNINVYASYNIGSTLAGTPIIQYGICPSGNYIDTVIGAAALAGQIQTNMFNALYGTTTKIPQTDAGQGQLEGQIVRALNQFVTNGYLGPNNWAGSSFGNLANGQFLPKGWYVYQPPVANQNPAQRAARVSVPFQVAAVMAGAINTASVQINVNY